MPLFKDCKLPIARRTSVKKKIEFFVEKEYINLTKLKI